MTKVEIHDAKPENILFDKAGNMHPVDVWIYDPDNYFGLGTKDAPGAYSAFPSGEDGSLLTNPERTITLARPAGIVNEVEVPLLQSQRGEMK